MVPGGLAKVRRRLHPLRCPQAQSRVHISFSHGIVKTQVCVNALLMHKDREAASNLSWPLPFDFKKLVFHSLNGDHSIFPGLTRLVRAQL